MPVIKLKHCPRISTVSPIRLSPALCFVRSAQRPVRSTNPKYQPMEQLQTYRFHPNGTSSDHKSKPVKQLSQQKQRHLFDRNKASSNSTWCLWLKDVDLYIKDYSQWALQHVKADSQRAELILTSFCADMTQLCLATLLDFSSICSVMDTAGRLSVAAQQQQPAGLSPTTQQLVPDLVRKLSKQLWPQRHQLRAYHVASVLTALSRTDEQMDTMPGLADALAEQFMQDSECYNAHRFASSLYSCAQMNINPCDGQLLEHILQRLPKLSLANFGARNVANTLFALTRVPILHHPAPVIDKLCNRMIRLMSSSKEEERPTEDDAASFLRSLRTLQHKPKDEFAPALVSWYAHVLQGLQDQSEQKASQRVGIILKACVDLRLQIPHRFIPMLLPHVFGIRNRRHPKRVKAEARASAARGLAALGILDQDTFQSLLSSAPQSLPWSAADLTQLRHALDWLQPESSDHPDHDKWLQLHKQLSASGQRPDPEVARSQPAVGAVCTVLEQCGVQYATGVQLGSCVAAVVIVAVGTTDAVIDVIGQEGTFKNEPKRLMGKTALRHELLAKHGPVISISADKCQLSADASYAYIKHQLQPHTGTSLSA